MIQRLVLIFGLIGLSVLGEAQAVRVATESAQPQSTPQRISVEFYNTPLAKAIQAIADQSGADIAFAVRSLPTNRITYSGKNVGVDEALTAVLRNTGVRVSRTAQGGYKLERGETQAKAGQGVIAGKVTDSKTGKGVSGATVSIGSETRGASSGEDGSYRVTGIGAGVHTVTVRLVGYAKQTRSVTVGEGATVGVDFKLEPSANVLDQVIVTGTIVQTELKAVPNAITVVTAKQIEERGITRIDQLFRGDIPGMFSMNNGSVSPLDEVVMFSRGATALVMGVNGSSGINNSIGVLSNSIKTYIDGIEMADSRYLSQIDPKTIERIEIITGPQASTIYGANAINGVMQIFTKRGVDNRPRINLNISSGVAQNNFNDHLTPSHITDANVSGMEGGLSYSTGGSWNYDGAWTPGKQTQRLSTNGGIRTDFGRIFTADASARRGSTRNLERGAVQERLANLYVTGIRLPSLGGGKVSPRRQTLDGRTFGVTLSARPFAWWSHELGYGTDASATEDVITGASFVSPRDTVNLSIQNGNTSRTSERYSTTLQLPLSSLAALNLILGGDHWRTAGSSWRASPISLTGTLAGASVTRVHPSKNSGAFVQGQLGLKDALFITYGIRADWNPAFGDDAKVKPGRYGVSYSRDIGPISAKLRGSYGRSIRPPGDRQKFATANTDRDVQALFGTFDLNLANPDLAPEHQQGGEGGIELYLGSSASLVVTRYNQTVDNLISLISGVDSVRSLSTDAAAEGECSSKFRDVNGLCYRYQRQYINAGSIRNQGWELQGSVNTGPLTTRGTYSWVKSRVLGVTPRYRGLLTTVAFTPGRPFDFIPEHTWALGFTYTHSVSSVSLSVNGSAMRYLQQSDLFLDLGNRLLSTSPRMDMQTGYRPAGPGYATADLNATHQFSSRMGATLQVNNLTNYYQNDFDPNATTIGRQSRVGLRLRW